MRSAPYFSPSLTVSAKTATAPVYTEIRPFSEGLGVIGFLGGKKGVIDKKGNIVIPFAYEYITAPADGLMTLYSYEDGWKLLAKAVK